MSTSEAPLCNMNESTSFREVWLMGKEYRINKVPGEEDKWEGDSDSSIRAKARKLRKIEDLKRSQKMAEARIRRNRHLIMKMTEEIRKTNMIDGRCAQTHGKKTLRGKWGNLRCPQRGCALKSSRIAGKNERSNHKWAGWMACRPGRLIYEANTLLELRTNVCLQLMHLEWKIKRHALCIFTESSASVIVPGRPSQCTIFNLRSLWARRANANKGTS